MRYLALLLLLPALAWAQPPLPPTPAPTFNVTLSWTPPTQNTDGSALTNLASYEVFYARENDGNWSNPIVVQASATQHVLTQNNLQADTLYYFTVRAVNAAGVKSAFSNVASRRTPEVTVPNPPTSFTVTIEFGVVP